MGYLIAVVLVLILVAGFVMFFVLNATKRGGPAAPADPSAEGNPAGIAAPDRAPLGDTTQHAGDQEGGRTTGDPEHAGPGDGNADGGGSGTPPPESERLANRPR
jgi:hypothetical protein